MITTVTLNAAVDRNMVIDEVSLGSVNRVDETQVDPGGKGINVSRVVTRLGYDTTALSLVGGHNGAFIRHHLDEEGVPHDFLDIHGETRISTSIMELSRGRQTSFHERGPLVTHEKLKQLEERLESWLPKSSLVVLAGSLPAGVSDEVYAGFVEQCHRAGVKSVLDTDGPPLAKGIRTKPYLIKPNVQEAQRVLGVRLASRSQIVVAAKELLRWGPTVVVISMGANGAIAVTREEALYAHPVKVELLSTIGSGDSMVAGLTIALEQGKPLEEGLRLGAAAGAATAMTPGTHLCRKEDVEALLEKVVIERLQP